MCASSGNNGPKNCNPNCPPKPSCGVQICTASDPRNPPKGCCDIKDLCCPKPGCPPVYCCLPRYYYPQPKCEKSLPNCYCPPYKWSGTANTCPICDVKRHGNDNGGTKCSPPPSCPPPKCCPPPPSCPPPPCCPPPPSCTPPPCCQPAASCPPPAPAPPSCPPPPPPAASPPPAPACIPCCAPCSPPFGLTVTTNNDKENPAWIIKVTYPNGGDTNPPSSNSPTC